MPSTPSTNDPGTARSHEPYVDQQQQLESHKLEVSHMKIGQRTHLGGITTHDSGGEAAQPYLGTWDRKRFLGGGTFGEVYLERNPATGMVRAVKKLTGGRPAWHDREISNMLLFKSHSKLFVKFFCWYVDDGGTVYIAMEYHPAGDLHQHVTTLGPLPEAVVRGITEQILQGVFVLHTLNVCHRDIKPENILVVSTNPIKIKIADFGGAKQIGGSCHTRTGTNGWMAPEIERQNYDASVDMWSVGCVVYYLLTSLQPFDDCLLFEEQRHIARYTFHFWPRLPLSTFQDSTTRKKGDQILVKELSNSGNDFLKHLIVRDPTQRMPAVVALFHQWICQTSPLQSALAQDNFPLARLLAKHDPRYREQWAEEPTQSLARILLRTAAATGNICNVERALKDMPSQYDFKYHIPTWTLKPALVGAAMFGSLPIVRLLIQRLRNAAQNHPIVIEACNAALEGGHHEVAHFLWDQGSIRDCAWDRQLSQHIARYANSALLDRAYNHWMCYRSVQYGTELTEMVRFGHYSSAYADHFPGMLANAARHGNTERVIWFLKRRPHSRAFGRTAIPDDILRQAILGGHFDIVVRLLKVPPFSRQTPDAPNPLLAAALIDAAAYGHLKIVKFLVGQGVIPCGQSVSEAVGKNHDEIFLYLIDALIHRFKIDGRCVATYITPAAVPHCDIPRLEWLRETQADQTIPGKLVDHVLHVARFGGTELLRWLLLHRGQDDNEKEIMKQGLIGACEGGHLDIVTLLCKRAANATIPDAWVAAAKGGHIAILDHLLLRHPTPSKAILRAALVAAASAGCLGTVLWLLCAGATTRISNHEIPRASPADRHRVNAKLKFHPVIQDLVEDFGSLK